MTELNKQVALQWARMGVPVFPCNPSNKRPLVEHGFKVATTQTEQVSAWWDKFPEALPGLATGHVFDVVDLDIDKSTGETVGESYVRENYPEAFAESAVKVQTPSGGLHLYFAPGSFEKNSAGRLPSVDTRAMGGYVVGAGVGGYEFTGRTDMGGLFDLSPCPESLVAAIKADKKDKPDDVKDGSTDQEITPERRKYAERALDHECNALRESGEGGRNHRLNTAAFNLGTLVGAGALTGDEVRLALGAAALDAGLDVDETKKTIASGLKTGSSRPRDLSWIKPLLTVEDFNERFVYISDTDAVGDLERPACYVPLPLKNFHTAHAHLKANVMVPAPTQKDPDREVEKSFHVSKLWVESDKVVVEGRDYHPTEGRIITGSRGRKTWNTYQRPEWIKDETGDVPAEFFRLLELLAPDIEDRELLCRWMAHTTHNPAYRSPITPLLITPAQGVGKGMFATIMSGLVGADNVAWPSMPELFADFNHFLADTTLAVVDEAAEVVDGRSSYVAIDSLRKMLTESRVDVNVKYQPQRAATVFANFLFLSNHEDAIKLREDDRRIFVIISDSRPEEHAFYLRLLRMYRDPVFLGRVAKWLESYVAEELPSHAPLNASKTRLIGASTADWVYDLRDILHGKDEVSAEELAGSAIQGVSNAHLSHEMRRQGFHQARKTVAGARIRYWARVAETPTATRH